ncbi:hypothetical protein BH09MYX1_BH09MYX1_09970 [soil metagenome]
MSSAPQPPATKTNLSSLSALTARPFESRPPPPPAQQMSPITAPVVPVEEPVLAPVNASPANAIPAEELQDLTDDVEMWAMGGTKILDKPTGIDPRGPVEIIPSPLAPTAPVEAAPVDTAFVPQAQAFAATVQASQYPQAMRMQPSITPTHAHAPQPSVPPMTMSTTPVPMMQPPPKKKSSVLLWVGAGLAVAFLGVVAIGGGAGYYFYHQTQEAAAEELKSQTGTTNASDSTSASGSSGASGASGSGVVLGSAIDSDPTIAHGTISGASTTATPTGTGASTAVTGTAPTTTARAATPTTTTTTTAPGTTARAATTAPQSNGIAGMMSPLKTGATPTVTTAAKGDGTLKTFAVAKGKPVYVDGKNIGLGGSTLKTTCGTHNIAVGTGKGKIVDVPCGGSITIGTADGS